jgi:hypothetical protein
MKETDLHPEVILKNLDSFEEVLEDSNLCLEELSIKDTFKEIREIISRFIPKKPNGNYYQTMTCPTCGARIRSGKGSSSRVRDDRCRKCGQLIDWH